MQTVHKSASPARQVSGKPLTVPARPRGRRPAFSFVVPVKNHLPLTRELVRSVSESNPGVAVEWIIVDSGSTDGTLEYCRQAGLRVVEYHREPFNYCAAVNAGTAAAGGDLWIIANNDVEFRSDGDLERLQRVFREWPVLGVVSPANEGLSAEVQFVLDDLHGCCWAVRPEAFREWGGLPPALTGYGYDELYTFSRCWRSGLALGRLPGWSVFHHGSRTFAPLGATTTKALRRNLSRLLRVMDAADLDFGNDQGRVVERWYQRELAHAPLRLAVPPGCGEWRRAHGYAAAGAARGEKPPGAAWVFGSEDTRQNRQWLPWLANELLLQPDARIVGAHGWYAVRATAYETRPDAAELDVLIWSARAVGPAPPIAPAIRPGPRPTWRQRLAAMLNDWRHRGTALPEEW